MKDSSPYPRPSDSPLDVTIVDERPAGWPLDPNQSVSASDSVQMAKDNLLLTGRLRTRIVVLGGGFAGVYTARHLHRLLGHREDVDIELLSAENYFVFQPLLPEVAAGGIAAAHAVNPIRELVRGVHFRLCKIQKVDFARKRVRVTQGDGLKTIGVRYDHLVFCLGKVSNFASMPGVAEHAMAMKDLGDAFELRNHVIRCLEVADVEPDPLQRQSLLTFLVAGGGFSGVETIGELCELVTRSLKYFPNIPKKDVLFKLVHAQDEILPEMSPELGQAARRILEKRGIEVILKDMVRSASPDRVYLKSGRTLYTRTFVCTAGNTTNPIARDALTAGRFVEAQHQGRPIGLFATDEMLQCLGQPGYWAVGDCAGVPNLKGQGLCPPTAQFAIRQARVCAQNIAASIESRPLKPFRFKALGMLASLGQRSAVAELMGVRLTGFVAWVLWRFIYLMKLPGTVRRLRVALDWFLDLFFPRDLTQLNTARRPHLKLHHYEAGEVIVAKGQLARHLYMIRTGEVEVWQKQRPGQPEQVLRRLGPQQLFGESALVDGAKHAESVRCVGPVDVLVMSREDFHSFVSQFQVLREHFAGLESIAAESPPEQD